VSVPVVQVEDLYKQFGQTVALRGVTFAVWPGEMFGYLGPNGAGKTTTVRILLGLLKPDKGHAEVFGQDVQADRPEVRQRLGVVLEQPGLYENLSAYDNLEYFARLYGLSPDQRQQSIVELLEQMGLARCSRDQVATFSKGMKQRLALARALLHDPDLLFLDEPMVGLDPEGQKEIRDLLLNLTQNDERTVFLCSHDLDEVQRLCSRIAILREGTLVVCDTLDNLAREFSTPVAEVQFVGAPQRSQVENVLQQMEFVTAWRWNCQRLQVEITDDDQAAALLKTLVEAQQPVAEARRVTRSLEEVYLNLVGKS